MYMYAVWHGHKLALKHFIKSIQILLIMIVILSLIRL